ncbi:MAG: c-type cytochrome [Gammaproteobacteria bacterium]
MSNHDDAVFVRNFSMVLVGLAVVGVMAFILAKIVNRGFEQTQDTSESVAARVAPMGQVNTGGEAITVETPQQAPGKSGGAAAPAADTATAAAESGDVGKATYDKVCFACHAQGIAGAPKQGDMAAWEARLEKGTETLYANAIGGFTGDAGMMPAKGGNPALSDAEVKAAVDYMLAAVGGGNGGGAAAAPAEEAPAAESADEPAPASEESAAEAAPAAEAAAAEGAAASEAAPAAEETATAAADGRGKEVYDAACFVCHTPGAAGAPKLGDSAAWSDRIAKGTDTLYHNAINGFMGNAGMMPPKGGRPDFSDDDIKAAVDYMVSASQ